ncbi:ROK family transcriptional regulator [Streptomyces sp. RY43-2]|uniref:ROK family transcriptional regulator n=1 Tax=Streptomyces macrolidinus TaxID=2952607 RepID=A0ABT0ZG96_9ACTN|nr:ROK family transcriptional regulator [Streptomyces macrolidinus]MCN9242588.1 ROK family transcriptional regulator [Streptomyces macrolidinus]
MAPSKPSLEMLRALTDENVLRSLMDHPRLTRAEISAHTGISKPTISDSVQRLNERGLVVDTGERTTGRGRVGSYYALAPSTGAALVAGITPQGVIAEAVDVRGAVLARSHSGLGHSDGPHQAARALGEAAADLAARTTVALRTAVVSAADPVDRATGRLVHLPDAPFLVGELDPPAVLAPHVRGPVLVDNDVNWAAQAEHHQGCAVDVADFVYLHLGEGLGCAVVNDGKVRRGHHGLAGEIAHLWTVGPDGTAMLFTEVFAALGLRRPGSTAIDTAALVAESTAGADRAARLRTALARAIGGVLAAAVSLADPRMIVIGGEWGAQADIVAEVREHFARTPRPVPVAVATLARPDLVGARTKAVDELRALIVRSARPDRGEEGQEPSNSRDA